MRSDDLELVLSLMVAMSLVVNSDRGVHTFEIDMGERIAALGLSVSCTTSSRLMAPVIEEEGKRGGSWRNKMKLSRERESM